MWRRLLDGLMGILVWIGEHTGFNRFLDRQQIQYDRDVGAPWSKTPSHDK